MVDVSIIIPTFDRLWSLPAAVESCRGGDCEVEIIVVDDGSNDGTWEWLLAQPDVIAVRQLNWGKDHAVNHGFAKARGEFVRFLDSDDLLAPGANDRQVATGRALCADMVVAGFISRDETTGDEQVRPWMRCDDFIAQQLGECDSSHYSAYLFRRTFIADLPHRQEFGVRDDRMFVIEAAMKRPRVAVVETPSLIHRQHGRGRLQFQHGLSSEVTNWQDLQTYRKAEALLRASGRLNARRRRAIAGALWPVAHRIAATHMAEACEVVEWIKRLDPAFAAPNSGMLGRMHHALGFRMTQYCVRLARTLRELRRRARPRMTASA